MLSEETAVKVTATISRLENIVATRKEFDLLWSDTRDIIINEIDKLPNLPQSSINKYNNKVKVKNFGMTSYRLYGCKAVTLKKLI